ncbi:hypothetical protein AAFF_G00351090 [Aldrovandia affinis]|uniref:Uncharacterized protein n=1 Tax=Aldrovandia affinis TaxID=143900 RepID=A0AAD7SIP2_9TELE|nr:hypothetical protein AAFF_G00351090 [Aldrovandia affinis]
MAFDTTTSSNHLTAACIVIKLSLGRPLLWSRCQHHIGEVLLSHFFTNLKVETSRSPEVAFFARLLDYKQLQLCLVYLGAPGAAKTPVTFPRHKARWMAKLLYTLKLALMERFFPRAPSTRGSRC